MPDLESSVHNLLFYYISLHYEIIAGIVVGPDSLTIL